MIPVGLNDPISEKQNVLVYPNPFSQAAMLKFDNPAGDEYQLKVMNISGQSALPSTSTTGDYFLIEKKSLSGGIYFYSLTNLTTGSVHSGKLIVK